MPQLSGTVGLAASQLGSWLNHNDAPRTRQAQQLHGQQGAAQPPANDQNIGLAGYRWGLSGVWLAHGCSLIFEIMSRTAQFLRRSLR